MSLLGTQLKTIINKFSKDTDTDVLSAMSRASRQDQPIFDIIDKHFNISNNQNYPLYQDFTCYYVILDNVCFRFTRDLKKTSIPLVLFPFTRDSSKKDNTTNFYELSKDEQFEWLSVYLSYRRKMNRQLIAAFIHDIFSKRYISDIKVDGQISFYMGDISVHTSMVEYPQQGCKLNILFYRSSKSLIGKNLLDLADASINSEVTRLFNSRGIIIKPDDLERNFKHYYHLFEMLEICS